MKKVMFAILVLPLLAGCFWNKKDIVETNMSEATTAANAEDASSENTMETTEATELDSNIDEK